MSRCCIYCRIGGTANEPNQIAMNSQLEMLRKAAEDLGLTVVAEVTVFESGTDPQRQSIKTLIRDGKHGAYDCVLIVDPSRLSRSSIRLSASMMLSLTGRVSPMVIGLPLKSV